MPRTSDLPLSGLPPLTPTAAIDILVVAFLIYQFIVLVRGRRAAQILTGVVILLAAYVISVVASLDLLRTVLATLAPYTGFALIVMFQSEIRRMLARMGRKPSLRFRELERREVADEILLALSHLSQQKFGALIVVERKIGLRTFVESGQGLDARISRDLLCSIFQPHGALHDGAVIVQGDRIAAASCFLPLNTNPQKAMTLGTRHRAAIGITEEADCIALVVSEGSGRISMATHGEIMLDVSLSDIEAALTARASASNARESAASVAAARSAEHAPADTTAERT